MVGKLALGLKLVEMAEQQVPGQLCYGLGGSLGWDVLQIGPRDPCLLRCSHGNPSHFLLGKDHFQLGQVFKPHI